MDAKNHNNNNGIGNGFLLGFTLGVVVTLLLYTKKGRQILQILTDKGIERFSKLDSAIQDIEEEFEDGDDYLKDVGSVSSGEGTLSGNDEDYEKSEKPQPTP